MDTDILAIRKTCKRENWPNHAHFLTFSCFNRRPFLSKDRTRGWLVDAIDLARSRHHFDLWAYVIMPEHVHLILFPRESPYSISAILSTIKQSVSKKAVLFVREEAPEFAPQMEDRSHNGRTCLRFWQRGGGYDRNLYSARELWEKIRYVHDNPVARGLVDSPLAWNWSSAADYAGSRTGPLRIDADSLPR